MNLTKSKGLTRLISAILSIAVIMSMMSFQLTAAYGKEEITYAHTIDYPINLRDIGDGDGQTTAKGDGYEWDDATNTLTLNNLHIDFSNVENSQIPVAGIILPSDKEEVTVIFNGANKITDVSVIECSTTPKVTIKGGSGSREHDSLEVVSSDERCKSISALGLGIDAHIEDLTMKMDLYWGSNFTNLTVKNSDITITSYDSSIYCLGYFRAADSILCFKSENSSAIAANAGSFDGVAETDVYVCDEPINISNSKVTSVAPVLSGMYTTKGNTVISDSSIDCGNSLVGLYLGDDIAINNSDVKNDCMTLISLNGKISIDESSDITGISQERSSKTITAYGKFIQTDVLNSNTIIENYTFIIDENAEITMADGISMQITGGTLINNGILKGTVEKQSGTIQCNNHCLTEIINNEDGTHIGKCSVCGEENIEAKEITFITGDNRKTVYTSSPKINKYLIPENPTAENMTFESWSETKAENFKNDANPFDFDSEITKDTTLYAVFKRDFEENAESYIDLIYGQEIKDPIHLSDYVKFADKTFDTEGQLDFIVSPGSIILDGLSLNNDGTITGTPIEDVREEGYKIKFIVTDKNPYISLASLESETDLKNTVLTINFNILKADPDVTVKPTENLVYDKEEKVLIDYNNTNTSGGEILYSFDNINYSNELPRATDANDYTIYYKVTGNNNYNDTEPKTITVTIAKADPLYEIPKDLTIYHGKTLAAIKLPNGFTWNDSTQIAGNIGTNTFKATYTPDDTNNYNIITDIDIPVNVLPPKETSPYGDVDGQIGITVNDASCLLEKVLDNSIKMPIEENEEYMTYADVDGDGKLTSSDAAIILAKVLDSDFIMPVEYEN